MAKSVERTKAPRAQKSRPNILVIWGDDIGQSNLSIFTKGVMGYDFLATFKDYPARQKAASFTIDQALESLSHAA